QRPPLLAQLRSRSLGIDVVDGGKELRRTERVWPRAVGLELFDVRVQRITLECGAAFCVQRQLGEESRRRRRVFDRRELRSELAENLENVEGFLIAEGCAVLPGALEARLDERDPKLRGLGLRIPVEWVAFHRVV